MRKRIKIWFHSGATSDIKEFSIHKAVLGLILFIIISAFFAISFIGYDYYRIKNISFNNKVLNQTIIKQKNEIKGQSRQIQSFA